MPRKKLVVPGARENVAVDCMSFYRDLGGKPQCRALKAVYCLIEDKPCGFRKAGNPTTSDAGRGVRR